MTRTTRRGAQLLAAAAIAVVAALATALPAAAAASITVDPTEGLNPKGSTLSVTGSGFKPGIQLYLVTCNPAVPSGGACDLANFSLVDVGADGSWTSKLKAAAKFGTTDCLKVGCAVQTSRVGQGADRTQETAVGIGFTGQTAPIFTPTAAPPTSPSVTASETATATPSATDTATSSPEPSDTAANNASDTSSSSGVSPVVWIVIAIVAILAVGAAIVMNRRKNAGGSTS